jgi:hypothetical protein
MNKEIEAKKLEEARLCPKWAEILLGKNSLPRLTREWLALYILFR